MAIFSRKTWHFWLGAGFFALAVGGSLAEVGWIRVWFYQFAWWGYICMADACIQRVQGNSLLMDRRRVFWTMCLVSAAFWFGWEMVNLRLQNWFYLGVPRQLWQRWLGSFIAFATVLPGIFTTYELIGLSGPVLGPACGPSPPPGLVSLVFGCWRFNANTSNGLAKSVFPLGLGFSGVFAGAHQPPPRLQEPYALLGAGRFVAFCAPAGGRYGLRGVLGILELVGRSPLDL